MVTRRLDLNLSAKTRVNAQACRGLLVYGSRAIA